ncbi:MAG TPA: VCBS repeat-containing protein [Pyrinomonadaceae bacterium]|jgi:hypothetical protein
MNKYLRRKHIIPAFSILFFALCFGGHVSAQILKPGEIVYSRQPGIINAPPRDGNSPTIWAVGQDGKNDRLVTTGTQPRISDDGRFLLFKRFTRANVFNPFGANSDMFVRELATGQETLIYAFNFEQNSVGYSFSPASNQGNNEIILDRDCFMFRANRNGSNPVQFPWANASYCADDFPVLRRGGDQLIAFHNLTNDGTSGGLYTVGVSGANRQKVANTNCGDLSPAWSNDSQSISYGSLFEACGNNFPQDTYPYFASNLFKIKPDGTGKQQLTNLTNTNCRSANTNCLTFGTVWTEDNSKIIAAGRINNTKGLFAFNTNGSGAFAQIPITPGNAPDFVGGIVSPRVEQNVLSFGGGVSVNGSYTLVSTLGEPVAGQTSAGGNYDLKSGFWAIPDERGKAPFDFDGDGKTDISIFRPSVGEWWYLKSSTGDNGALQFGTSSDILVPGDYTGDGKADIAVFRPASGFWYIQRSEDNSFFAFPFGASEDIPAPSDYDGDGKSDAAVFRPSTGTWFILNSSGSGTSIVNFGISEDKPVPADFDGDGKADIAIFRPSDGSWWYLQSSDQQFKVYRFGVSTDKPVQGDWTGDGKADIAVFRSSSGEWFIQRSEDNSFYSVPFGASGDLAAPGDYDGDGRFDTAVFRPSTANWFVQRSSAGILITSFGTSGDRPIPNAFVP